MPASASPSGGRRGLCPTACRAGAASARFVTGAGSAGAGWGLRGRGLRRAGLRSGAGARFRAVIFDLGGVVLDSPLHAIARYERELGIPQGHVNRVVAGNGARGAWARLERGEIGLEAFVPAFEREGAAAGPPP